MAAELTELSRLHAPDPGETTDVPRVAEPGETTDVPRVAEPGETTDVPRVAEPGETTDVARVAEPAPRRTRRRSPPAPSTAEERRAQRAAQRRAPPPEADRTQPAARAGGAPRRRGRIADWTLILAAVVLFISLFLPWSHQFSASLLAHFGSSPILFGVPRTPDAWQVYSIVDALLAVLALAVLLAALIGGRAARLVLSGFVLIALAFTVHALQVAPTNGANILDTAVTPTTYYPNSPRPGTGEDVAVVALGLSLIGIALSFTGE
jgi:hypothetical protein